MAPETRERETAVSRRTPDTISAEHEDFEALLDAIYSLFRSTVVPQRRPTADELQQLLPKFLALTEELASDPEVTEEDVDLLVRTYVSKVMEARVNESFSRIFRESAVANPFGRNLKPLRSFAQLAFSRE
jgi:hypothetical protein